MNIARLEDETLFELAKTVVPSGDGKVKNAQITGLLSTIRASRSLALLRKMSQHQLTKAAKDGDRSESMAAFYGRLVKALGDVEKYADEHVRGTSPVAGSKLDTNRKQLKDEWAGRLALTLMTHIAAEHRWMRSDQ